MMDQSPRQYVPLLWKYMMVLVEKKAINYSQKHKDYHLKDRASGPKTVHRAPLYQSF